MKVHGVARFGKDPELRYAPSGTAFCNASLAWSTGIGENKKTTFMQFVASGKNAENIAKFFKKGERIEIKTGELSVKKWEAQDGQKKERPEVFIQEWGFVDGGNAGNKDKNDNLDTPPADDDNSGISLDDLPF